MGTDGNSSFGHLTPRDMSHLGTNDQLLSGRWVRDLLQGGADDPLAVARAIVRGGVDDVAPRQGPAQHRRRRHMVAAAAAAATRNRHEAIATEAQRRAAQPTQTPHVAAMNAALHRTLHKARCAFSRRHGANSAVHLPKSSSRLLDS